MVAQRECLTGWRGNNYRFYCGVSAVLPLYPPVPRVTADSCPSVPLRGLRLPEAAIPHHDVTYETH